MKRTILPLLLVLVLLVSGCGDKSIKDNVSSSIPTPGASAPAVATNPGELPEANADGNIQVSADTTMYNDYFGIELIVPAGWWISDVVADNIAPKQGITGSMSGFDMSDSNGYEYMKLMWYANLEDMTKDAHTDFFYIVERVDGISDLEEFCEDDNTYREGEDDGYYTVLLEQKAFTLGSVSGICREYEVTHDEYSTYTTMLYTIDVGDGYFFTVDSSFYNSNSKGLSIIEEHIANNIKVTGASV